MSQQEDEFIFRSNIKRFEAKLKHSTDEGERKILRELIVQERSRFKASKGRG